MHPTAATRFSVHPKLTTNRRTRARRSVENTDYTAFVQRIIRAHGRRVANGDIESLIELAQLAEHLDTAIFQAIQGLRGHGHSWTDIARGLGVTKQAAHKRWGTR